MQYKIFEKCLKLIRDTILQCSDHWRNINLKPTEQGQYK